MKPLVLYAIPAFVGLMLLEGAVAKRSRQIRGYERRDTRASLYLGIGNLIVAAAVGGFFGAFFLFLYEHRLWTLGEGIWGWGLTFVAEDFTYYWWHRSSHESRFLWAAHENHHSSRRYNLSTALRQSWTTPFTTGLFYWPLPLLGIHPAMMATATSVSLLYQFWIHTECIDRLGPLESVFNTPSHHRVHHGSNVEYLDRNHGGILIVWDRLFGTFEMERAPVRYGLTKNVDGYNPFFLAFHEWVALLRDMHRATSWRNRIALFFAPPGWSPDGATLTAKEMQRRARTSAPVGMTGRSA